jgi:transposase
MLANWITRRWWLRAYVFLSSSKGRSVRAAETPAVVASAFRIASRTMYGWLAWYRRGGWNALEAKPLSGRPPKLCARALQWIYDTVTQNNPLQRRFPLAP